MSTDPGDITTLLHRWSLGDPEAFPRLVALAYDDLRAIAHRRLLGGGGTTLPTTALVHEVFLRLVERDTAGDTWESRAHFYAFASRAMRTILVDHARRTQAARRGGDQVRIPLDESAVAGQGGAAEVLGVDEALTQLARQHPRMAQVVEFRFFGGFDVTEVAELLGTSVRTVERDWTRAKAYLLESLQSMNTLE
jgi:RNA polymerase sigma factor (TIGR02999 family)